MTRGDGLFARVWSRRGVPAARREADAVPVADMAPPKPYADAEGGAEADDGVLWATGETVLGTYRIVEQVGAGGMGVVHRVRHGGWNEDLAVKSPRPELWASGITEFVEEAEVWVNLPPHPHLCTCHYVRVLGGVPRIFAEFVEGGTVAGALAAGRLDGPAEILDAAIQMAWGLRAAHEAGVVHQDVKLANALITPEGLVKITDFGLARAQERAGSHAPGGESPEDAPVSILATYRGMTPAYASPEQVRGQRAGRRSDVWSWAVSVLELFTGEVTWWSGSVAAEALDAYRADGPPPGRPAMPQDVAALLRECFAADPDSRPADLGEAAERLIAVYGDTVGTPYPRQASGTVDSLSDELNNKALSLLDLGRTEQAKECWDRALEADPHHLDATFNSKLGQWREGGITDLQMVDELERFRFSLPDGDARRGRTAYLLGLVHHERGDTTAAADILRQAAEAAPGDRDIAAAQETVAERARAEAGTEAGRTPLPLVGHEGKTCPLALSADGRHAVSGGEDGTVRRWDLTTGDCLLTMTGHAGSVHAVALSADGRHAASAGLDHTVRWWDLATGSCLRTLPGRKGVGFRWIDLSTDGRYALAGDDGGTVWWWELATGRRLCEMTGHEGPVNGVAVLPDARRALSAGEDGTVRYWDLTSGRCLRTFAGHGDAVYTIALLPDGTGFVSCGRDGTVRSWDLATGRCLRVLTYLDRMIEVLSPSIFSVAVGRDGRTVFAGDKNGSLTWWDLATGRCRRTFPGTGDAVNSVAVAPDGRTAMSSGFDKTVRRWELATGDAAPSSYSRPRSTLDLGAYAREFRNRTDTARLLLDRGDSRGAGAELRRARALPGFGHNSTLVELWRRAGHAGRRTTVLGVRQTRRMEIRSDLAKAVGITSNARHALVSSGDGQLRWWDLTSGTCVRTLTGDDGFALALALTPDGRRAVTVEFDVLRWWDLHTGRCRGALPIGADGPSFSVALTPDGRRALTSSVDGAMRWWDLAGRRCLKTLTDDEGIASVAVTADGRRAVTGGSGGTVGWWDLTAGECLRTFTGHGEGVSAIAVTPDGRYAVSGSTSGAVYGWDLAAGTGREMPAGHFAQLNSVAISADGRHALSGGEDRTLRWWDLREGRCVHQVRTMYVASAAMTPSAHHAVSGMADGSLLLWDIDWDYDFPAG